MFERLAERPVVPMLPQAHWSRPPSGHPPTESPSGIGETAGRILMPSDCLDRAVGPEPHGDIPRTCIIPSRPPTDSVRGGPGSVSRTQTSVAPVSEGNWTENDEQPTMHGRARAGARAPGGAHGSRAALGARAGSARGPADRTRADDGSAARGPHLAHRARARDMRHGGRLAVRQPDAVR